MALSLYASTFKIVLRVNTADEDSWSYIYGSLRCLRQALLCSVCRKLVLIPYHPANSMCQHNYCRKCIDCRKPQCEWCIDGPDFKENVRLRIILQCYKSMCKYIISSAICRNFNRSTVTSPMLRFISMVSEGSDFVDVYHYRSIYPNEPTKKRPKLDSKSDSKNNSADRVNGQRSRYRFKLKKKSPKALSKKAPDASSDSSEINCPQIISECFRSVKKCKSCCCGMDTQHPGNFTCCGQYCPCYVNGRACINCRCIGCRNPQKNLIASPPYCSNHPNHDGSNYTYIDGERDDGSDGRSYSDSGRCASE